MVKQRDLRQLLVAGVLSALWVATAAAAPRPNILLIVADDLGYGDIGCFRGAATWKTVEPAPASVKPAATPNIDRLASGGLMLTDFHANDSVCSPTRAAIMTGRYQHRSGMVNVLGQLAQATKKVARPGEQPYLGLRLSETTVAEVLHEAGYRTACFGKWHLGPLPDLHPMDQGFDHFVGTNGGAEDNFAMRDGKGASIFCADRELVNAPGKYFTDVLADEASDYMAEKSDRPFFVYLPLTAPHVPYFGPNDKGLAWDGKDAQGPRQDLHQAYQEIIGAIDGAVGRLEAALQKAGLAENTLVIFTSDNGPVDCGSCTPWRGRKTNLYEGGTRVPAIFNWPGKIEPGRKWPEPAMTMDLLPTFAALAGAKIPPGLKLDGVSLAPLLEGGSSLPPRKLFWERRRGSANVAVSPANFRRARRELETGATRRRQAGGTVRFVKGSEGVAQPGEG